jgi:hypothetical protein
MASPEVGKDTGLGVLRRLLDKSVVRGGAYLHRRIEDVAGYSTAGQLRRMAVEESAVYVRDHMMPCGVFPGRYRLLDHALDQIPESGLVLEFGVRHGRSINYIARHLGPRVVEGFDSFEGLAGDWVGTSSRKGAFTEDGRIPPTLANVRLTKGWFEETLPGFLAEREGSLAFAHLDADTYEATAYVLEQLLDRLVEGSVIQFDEYLGYPGWRYGEHRAFGEFARAHQVSYRYLGVGFLAAAVRVESVGERGGPVETSLPDWMGA